jgi:hypothetical protein
MKIELLLKFAGRFVLMLVCLNLTACWTFNTPPPLAPDAYEPNDTLQQATPLVGVIEGRISEGDNPDMFSVMLKTGSRAKITLKWTTNSNSPHLELFDPNGTSLGVFIGTNAGKTFRFEPSKPPSDLKAFPDSLEVEVATAGKYTISLTSWLTECPPEAGCPVGRSSYTLSLIQPSP